MESINEILKKQIFITFAFFKQFDLEYLFDDYSDSILSVYFGKPNLDRCLQLEIDLREIEIFVLLTKLEKGKKIEGYYRDKNGSLIREHIDFSIEDKMVIKNFKNKFLKKNKDIDYLLNLITLHGKLIFNFLEKNQKIFSA